MGFHHLNLMSAEWMGAIIFKRSFRWEVHFRKLCKFTRNHKLFGLLPTEIYQYREKLCNREIQISENHFGIPVWLRTKAKIDA